MLSAPGAAALAARWRETAQRTRGLALASIAVPLAVWLAFSWGRGIAGAYPGQDPHTVALAEWLRANTASTDTLFVWGHYSPIYTLSGRLPGTRYVNTAVHMGNFDPEHIAGPFDPAKHRSQRDIDATLSDLQSRAPGWFVDTSPARIHRWDLVPLAAFPELARYLERHYVEVARPGGAPVYHRLPTAAVQASGASQLRP